MVVERVAEERLLVTSVFRLETEYEAFEELGDDATGLPKSPAASAPAADDGPRLLVSHRRQRLSNSTGGV